MSSPTQTQGTVESAELTLERRPVPMWILILFFLLIYWGMLYFDLKGGWFKPQVYPPYRSLVEVAAWQPRTDGPNLSQGKKVYDMVCGLCHNPDGMGKPNQAPPLAGSEWALGGPERVIRIPLLGLTGPITVKGQEWNLSMTAMGASLNDEDLAAVLTYVRMSWGNNGSEITPAQVKAVRAALAGRNQPTTVEELSKLPDTSPAPTPAK